MATNTYMHTYDLEIFFTVENNEILWQPKINKYSLDVFIPKEL